uniref:WGS project CAEQ00000000 data, annotated contig 1708 n=1 Tax=Trypanosoma congolense (strain IL3000) TaxID=1068625 RepID=F9W860_TRYCI|nr:unnamed protein product [Trypanosoma congolense IL3000]
MFGVVTKNTYAYVQKFVFIPLEGNERRNVSVHTTRDQPDCIKYRSSMLGSLPISRSKRLCLSATLLSRLQISPPVQCYMDPTVLKYAVMAITLSRQANIVSESFSILLPIVFLILPCFPCATGACLGISVFNFNNSHVSSNDHLLRLIVVPF